jgi:hypothetical protein
MRVELRGLHTVIIGDWHEGSPPRRSFHPARQDALAYLRDFTGDRANCAALRALLAQQGVAVAWMDDADVAAEVAAQLVSGRLAIIEAAAEVEAEPAEAPAAPEAPPAPAPPPPAPAPARREPVREPEPVAEPATLDPSVQDEQAEILELAAAEGTPFCEECEKLRQEAGAA